MSANTQRPHSASSAEQPLPPPAELRQQRLEQLMQTTWDVLVVGGGSAGLGCALDAALRGLRVAVVDAGDWGGGASQASTKLVHGGVRYLEKAARELSWGQYQLVREALRERSLLLHNAPAITRQRELVAPVGGWVERQYFRLGLRAYDTLAGNARLGALHWPKAHALNKTQLLNTLPGLAPDVFRGGVAYTDGQMNDAGLSLALMRAARKAGCLALNYLEVTRLAPPPPHTTGSRPRSVAAELTDRHPGAPAPNTRYTLHAHTVLNCTGPQADRLRQLARPQTPTRLRPSQGIHLSLDPACWPGDRGLLIPETQDGRVAFVLPWQGGVIAGTTEHEVPDPQAPVRPSLQEIRDLLTELGRYLRQPPTRQQLRAVWAGVRPLVASAGGSGKTEALIRNHEVEVFAREQFVSLLGGKWTTYRQMAQDAVDALFPLLERPFVASRTPGHPLPACPGASLRDSPPEPQDLLSEPNLQHWLHETDAAQPADLLRRRTPYEALSHAQALDHLDPITQHLAAGWGYAAETTRQLTAHYRQRLQELDTLLDQAAD